MSLAASVALAAHRVCDVSHGLKLFVLRADGTALEALLRH
jgi:hypothetical protein